LLDPDNDGDAIVASVGADPILAAAVLRAGNSALFGRPGRAFTLSEAVGRLGRWELRALVVAELGRRALATPLPSYGMDRGSLWRTGVAGALAGREWARRSVGKRVDPEAAYLAGVLRDIGKLAVAPHLPENFVEQLESLPRDADFARIEEAHAGFDHASLSAAVARRSGVDPSVADAIAHHHSPAKAQAQALSAAVHLGDATALLIDAGPGVDLGFYNLDPIVLEVVPEAESALEEVMSATLDGLEAVADLLDEPVLAMG
jgi:putative nucleotidyltransferase with HDIG domain